MRLSLRPTARGWQALVIGALALVVARMIGTTQFHQLAYALLLLPVASLVLGMLCSRGLSFHRRLPKSGHITAKVPAEIDLIVENRSRFGTSVVEARDFLPERREFEFEPLEGGEEADLRVQVTFPRRGIYELGPAETSVVDPFELLRLTRSFEEKTEVVVYPEVHELRGFPVRAGSDDGGRGVIGQRGDEFAGLREYRRGDDRRFIHWKSLARTGELHVKEFALHAPKRYTVALDLRRGGPRSLDGAVEDAVSAAASVLARLKGEGLPFRLVCADSKTASTGFASNEASYWRMLRTLASVRADGHETLADAVLEERASLGEGVVMVSRNLDGDLADCARRLLGAGLSVVVAQVAPHTYLPGVGAGRAIVGREADREAAFSGHVERLERAGAAVRVVRHPAGVAGIGAAGKVGR